MVRKASVFQRSVGDDRREKTCVGDSGGSLSGVDLCCSSAGDRSGNYPEPSAHVIRVDALLDDYVLPMGESRQQFIDRYGMEKGAELLVTLAFGERMLNRVWSAAADGHLPEAVSSLEESAEAFEEAVSLLPAS